MTNETNNAGQTLGIIAIILGGLALILSFTCIGFIAILPGIVAIVLSAISLSQANKENAPRGLSVSSLIISIVATVIATLWIILFSSIAILGDRAVNDKFHFIEKYSNKFKNAMEDEMGESIEDAMESLDDAMDNMENKLEDLEKDLEKLEDPEKAERLGTETGKAVKKLTEIMEDSDTLKK